MNLLPQLLLVAGSALWGLGWIPLQLLAERGLIGMPLVLLTYSLLGVLALPVLWAQRRQWAPQSRQLLAIALFGGWATAALVSALAGRETILAAYREAVRRRYRFYSLGDAMLIR